MNDKNIGEHGVNVNFTVFVSTDEGMYIGVFGDSDIYIYKQGKLVDISEMLKSKGAKTAAVAMDEEDLILSLIHISEPTRLLSISYAVFCLKKKKIKY